MSIHVALNHVTTYRYDRRVSLSPQVVRLRPAPHCRTPILAYSLGVEPSGHFLNWQQDPQSNYLARLVFPEKVSSLRVEVDLVAEMAVYNPFDFFLEPQVECVPFSYDSIQRRELAPYLVCEAATPRFAAMVDSLGGDRGRTVDFLVELTRRLQREVRYLIRLEPGVQTKERTLELGSGSCRDSAWLLVQILRHLGMAARFVSGYLIQLTPDVPALDGPSGTDHDFTDLHAWCEVFLPGAGWVGLDPTSGLLAGEGHIPLACTPEPASAAPVVGGVEACEVEFEHAMSVSRIRESPRVTKPYSDHEWDRIVLAGRRVDESLVRGDVRLTMGGEPTFVSVDDRDGVEWNTAALGPTKRAMATDLLLRLRRHYGRDGFLHFGQGKWYPGEQLPRWALGCYWRRDGEPAWRDERLIAKDSAFYGFGAPEAERFARGLCDRLGVGGEHLRAAYEDAWYYLWRERRLPANVDPYDARLDDELERERLQRVFSQGLGSVVGYALPLASEPVVGQATWRSGPWIVRGDRMVLMPGDSPMGYRLPLDSLPWVSGSDYPYLVDLDPTVARPPLPPHARLSVQGRAEPRLRMPGVREEEERDRDRPPRRHESASWLLRTALCVEPRGGTLHVFLPPCSDAEAYLGLVAAVEDTAGALDMPVRLEGYAPPPDPRLAHFSITPDPGVVEVNVHPAATWDDLVERTTTLYEEARLSRLSTEKFQLDGRHTGTGGGNHFVLGGAWAGDSPFLRRPDLLASLIRYWNNHPSLSYLFSGLFIGPTSQAPRVDEARHENLYEVGVALDRLASARDSTPPPWLVDRALRHLLVDATGNTHRAEFCIDKMYSPDSSAGRLGLLELRAFEMPPHARMSLAQQLLLRSLVARFWERPYEAELVPWGTQLHDRFLLPHFVWQDFEDVIAETDAAGFELDPSWFAPHFEFRFPRHGSVAVRGVELELRQALEPWHVLGEEGSVAGTTRFVDSSMERLELRARGLTEGRYAVLCNGSPVPLHPTGVAGESVAGVRFRAWQPPSCLHPTIPVQAPLTFDLVDTWSERSLGGCRYHVAHPGGRAYDRFPVNSYEAESRRLARFVRIAHTPGRIVVDKAEPSRDFPLTLDLRAVASGQG